MTWFLAGGIILFSATMVATVVGLVAGNLRGGSHAKYAAYSALTWGAIFLLAFSVQSLVVEEGSVLDRVLVSSVLSSAGMVFAVAFVILVLRPRR